MTIGPEDPAMPGRDRLRAARTDREYVIEMLKNAFVHGQLARDELGLRVGRALAARTCGDLEALTAGIPPAPAAARPPHRPAPARRRPLARTAAISGSCLIIAPAAFLAGASLDPFGAWRGVMIALAVCTLWTAIATMGCALFIAWDQKSPAGRRRPGRAVRPSRPGSAAYAAGDDEEF